MRVGIITSIPWLPDTTPEQCFTEALEEVELAEALGFDSVWFTEHHVANSTHDEIKRDTQEGVTWFFDVARWFATGTGHAGGTMYDTGPMARIGFDFDQFYEQNSFFGDPETCFQKIERFCRGMRPTDLVCLFKLGQPHKRVAEAMELFAREVMPRVRQLNFD